MVLIVVDTLRADMVVGDRCDTPGIDSLGADGVVFARAFSHAPMTLPAHTSLFSSRSPFETGVLNNRQDVRKDLPLLTEWLSEAGYQTRAVVSLGTLDKRKGMHTLARGFDSYDQDYRHVDTAPRALERMKKTLDRIDTSEPFFLFLHFSDPHEPYNSHGPVFSRASLVLDGRHVEDLSTSQMTLIDREIELTAGEHVFELRSDEGFKLRMFQVGRWDSRVSNPDWEEGVLDERIEYARIRYDVDEEGSYLFHLWISDTDLRERLHERYEGEVRHVDRAVGELLEELKSRGIYGDSLVLLTSDHGEALGEHSHVGHVQNLHEEMLHVPLIVKLPSGHPGEATLRTQADRLVPHQDVVPTILDVLKLPGLPGQRGSSLLKERTPLLYAETHKPESKRTYFCIRDERFKLVFEPENERFEMYDLENDPGETRDVFAARAGERPDWPDRLRTFNELASRSEFHGEVSDDLREQLEALGYAGN